MAPNRPISPLPSPVVVQSLERRYLLSALPPGWSDNDIGAPPLNGSANYTSNLNTYTVSGSGTGIAGSSDQFHFTNYAMTGDGSITALLSSQSIGNPAAQAGVMIRSDLTPGSLFAAVGQTSQSVVTFTWRSAASSQSAASMIIAGPLWLRVNDQGNNFSGYYSSDNVTWTQIGATESISMPSATVLSGIWSSFSNSPVLNTAQFSDVSLARSNWTDNDVGSPAIGGAAVYDSPSDTTTVYGNGSDIYGTSDQFNFASTTMTGDGSAIAYVDSLTNTNAYAKAGVMIRNDSTAASAYAGLFVSATNGVTFEWRAAAGGSTNQEISSPAGGPTPAPVGLKLNRAGSSFTAFYSTDGTTWISVGPSQTVPLNTGTLAGLAVTSHNTGALCTATFSSVSIGANPAPGAGIYSSSDQSFLNNLEDAEVQGFYDEANPTTGLIPDNSNANGGNPSADSSIAAIGFGLSALTIGDSRGWLSHSASYQRALTTINFLYNSGANNNGFFYHFLNSAGGRYGTSEISSVDTAELMSGVLNAAQYWAGTPLQSTALAMFNRVNWPWMQQSNGIFYGAWTPESGFSGNYSDYSEASLLYLVALGSPTHPITQASWLAWSRTPAETYSGYSYVDADDNALFTVQYPMAWFNLQGLTDSKGLNYYQNAQTATLAQRQWMIDLSSSYPDFGANLWGLTPAEGVNGYTIWGGPPANVPVDGTVVPTASGGSLEFTPRLSANVLENMLQTYGSTVYQKYGLVDAFNPLTHWTSSLVLGIDIGMTLISAENSRSNEVWNVFAQTGVAQQALAKAFPSSAASVWIPTATGNWNTSANWANGTVPNTAGAEADFYGAIAASHSVYSDVSIKAGTLNFNNANTYVIDGAGSLALQAAIGSANIIVQQGVQEINLPLTLASNTTFNVSTGATLIIGDPLTVNSGLTLTQTGGGTVLYQSQINLQAGATIALSGETVSNSSAVQLTRISFSGSLNHWTSKLDLSESNLIVSSGDLTTITNQIEQGVAGVSGIVSSAAIADSTHLTTIGSIQNNDGSGSPLYTSFGNVNGLTITDVLLKYTCFGDTNLDGGIDGSDYSRIDNGYLHRLSGWYNGDFNYDGHVDGSDYTLIDNAFNSQQAKHTAASAALLVSSRTTNAVRSSIRSATYVNDALERLADSFDAKVMDTNRHIPIIKLFDQASG